MKTDKHKDAELVKAYQSGNDLALAELVRRWHLTFCKKAHWILKDSELAKDIAQETWQTIMVKISDLHDPQRFGSWALRIVYSKSLDVIRKSARDSENYKSYAKDHRSLMASEPNKNSEILKLNLLEAIGSLPIQQQQVIKLFYTENYSIKEIGNLLDISVGTTKSRLFHAREKLKQHLKSGTYEN
ncbi:MAG: sigma-70 family RNA polymerase sigma factor [Flavobacteriaceae bacterium]|nr:sigma-70 family RNA polymerase sigma factor [Flavobacteriaceae bacterium]